MKDQISGSRLLKRLGMAYECKDCPNKRGQHGALCGLGSELMNVCDAITDLMDEEDGELKNEGEHRDENPEILQPDLASIVGTEAAEKMLAQAAKVGEAVGELISQFLEALG